MRDNMSPAKGQLQFSVLWTACNCLQLTLPSLAGAGFLLVLQLGTIENEYRVFDMEVIAGEQQFETEISQHGVRFRLDFSKVSRPARDNPLLALDTGARQPMAQMPISPQLHKSAKHAGSTLQSMLYLMSETIVLAEITVPSQAQLLVVCMLEVAPYCIRSPVDVTGVLEFSVRD